MSRSARLVGAVFALFLLLGAAAEASAQLRGVRYCEVLGVYVRDGALEADVWNTTGFNLCPPAEWEALDPLAIRQQLGALFVLLNGPRFWTLDFIVATPSSQVMTFGTLTMRLAATVQVPGGGAPAPYTETFVDRDTQFIFFAGSEVYELVDPTGRVYVMQSYSHIVDDTLTEADLPGLGSRLQLPPGWSFRARVVAADYVVEDQDGVATVIQDDLSNTYQFAGRLAEPVDVDIKPGSCPNSWNRASNGVLPVAVLGSADLDVTAIDAGSVRLCLPGEDPTDPDAACVAPHEGPPGPRTVVADVGTPFEGEACDCHALEGDGHSDLSMKFRTQDVVAALGLESEAPGALVELVVAGVFTDGTRFEGSDCVRLVPPGTPPGLCRVQSNAAGAWIDAAPLDEQLDGGGFAGFERTYAQSTEVTLTASPRHGRRTFQGWRVDGGALIEGAVLPLTIASEAHEVEAVYSEPPCGLGFELAVLVAALLPLLRRRRV